MWIQVLLIIISGVEGVMADESRTALIASGCVAGGVLIVAIAVGVGYGVLRYFHRKEKKALQANGNREPVFGEFYPPEKVPSHSSSVLNLIEDSRREPRSLGAKAFTQHAANTRHRPPVAFYTIRADPRMVPELPGVMHMGPPMYARPPPIGRPVIFLDRNGPHGHLTTEDMMVPNGREPSEMPRHKRTSRETRRVHRDTSPSKSRSRSRDTEISRSHHNSSNETAILANPGDIILRTKDETGVRTMEQTRIDNNTTVENHIGNVDETIRRNINDHATFTETKEIVRNEFINIEKETHFSDIEKQGPFSVINTPIYPSAINATSYRHNVVGKEEQVRTFDIYEEDHLPSPQQDYSTDSLLNSASTEMHRVIANENHSSMSFSGIKKEGPFSVTNTTVYPSAISATSYSQNVVEKEEEQVRTFDIYKEDHLPSPQQDYSTDSLLNSASTEMHRVIANENHSSMSPFLDKVAERLEFQESTVITRTVEEFQDPIPSPTEDYPDDTPMSSDTYQKIVTVTRSPAMSRETKGSTKTEWVDLPTLVSDRDSFADARFNRGDTSTTVVTSTRFSRSTNDFHENNADSVGLTRRQNPSLTHPPSPPLMKRLPSPHFNVYPPKTAKSEEARSLSFQTKSSVLTPTFSNDGYISPVSSPPTPPPLHLGNLNRHSPTPPPVLIKRDRQMNIDDIINLRKEPTAIDDTFNVRKEQINIDEIITLRKEPVNIDYSMRQKTSREEQKETGGLPFLGELLSRQRTIDSDSLPSPPALPAARSPSPLLASLSNSKRGLFDDDVDEDALRKPSVVHFAKEPPEVIYRDSSRDYSVYYDSKSSHDYELDPSSPVSSSALSPPPPPPPPPPAPPLPR